MNAAGTNEKFLIEGGYMMPKTGPAPAYQKHWLDYYGVTPKEVLSHLRMEGIMSAKTYDEKEKVWKAACRRAMRKKKKDAANAAG